MKNNANFQAMRSRLRLIPFFVIGFLLKPWPILSHGEERKSEPRLAQAASPLGDADHGHRHPHPHPHPRGKHHHHPHQHPHQADVDHHHLKSDYAHFE